jgi:hypothetical protein
MKYAEKIMSFVFFQKCRFSLCFSKSVCSLYKSNKNQRYKFRYEYTTNLWVHIKGYLASVPPICAKNPTSNHKPKETTNHSVAEESKAPEARYGLRSIPGRKNIRKPTKIHSLSRKRRMKKGKGTKNPHPIVMPIYHDIGKGADDGGRA